MVTIDLMNWTALLTAFGALALALAQAWVMIQTARIKRTTDAAVVTIAAVQAQAKTTDEKVVKVGEAVDGKMEALKGLIEKSAHLAGKAEGIAEERADPQTHAVTTIKDDEAATVPPKASKRG